jgi:cellulose synthase/poly-beta-1,6-N-acetylglucosamine synthase-like glycosyltransferase
MAFFEILYVVSVALLSLYGYNSLILAWIRDKRYTPPPEKEIDDNYDWPQVTVQLPIFNERYVAERLIEAVGRLEYPQNRLQIQVLDDSTDITKNIVAEAVALQQAKGIDIQHVQRPDRTGFKGGALEYGLASAKGDYIAIFDADFFPHTTFLKRVIPYFNDDNQIGCLQTRWGHLNQDYSWLTHAQANGIDGHFIVEQEVRSANGVFLNFNGTAGVWKKSCIQDAGGWHHDTLTEDLDLSYRAQLRGWKIKYLPHVIVPAELPVHINALKRQQFRWAKGSIQTARKLLGKIWKSGSSIITKIEGTIHLTNYVVHPLILMNLLLTLPLIKFQSPLLWFTPVFTLAALGPLYMYWMALKQKGRKPIERLRTLAILVVLGMGLSLNNARAVMEALLGKQSSFLRTPKFNIQGRKAALHSSDYLLPIDANTWLETLLAIYSLSLFAFVLINGVWSLVIWLFLYASGYIYIASLNFRQSSASVNR